MVCRAPGWCGVVSAFYAEFSTPRVRKGARQVLVQCSYILKIHFSHLKIKVSAHLDFEMSERGGREGNIAHFKIKVSAHLDFEMSKRGRR